ncbi:hypothetical protein [Streptomyces mangrovisoli]|uniref:hypothetical protein n=1 Tax=Streptomyces mangrovisoli TaxID=1428628 RepID=UPI00116058ED|nr:hypothetical protein [Streptomyces mangrovisoli]
MTSAEGCGTAVAGSAQRCDARQEHVDGELQLPPVAGVDGVGDEPLGERELPERVLLKRRAAK